MENNLQRTCTCDDLTEVQKAQDDHYDDCSLSLERKNIEQESSDVTE